ncbi:MAG: hypothetical protein KA885_04630, partial [Spirochaetes bacterium]|nr:hypothetical protein [Spirochaetota bacterium]
MTYLTNNETDFERIILEYENKIIKYNNNNLENYKFHFSKAIYYFKKCDYKETIEEITICIDLDVDKKDYLLRGICYLENEETESAISDFNDYISVFLDDYIGYYFRGISNKILEKYFKAIKDFKSVIKINKDYIYAYLNLSDVLIQIENYSDALKCYKEIFSIEPIFEKDDNINYNISICYFNMKNYNDSLIFINNIDNKFNGEMFFHRGNIFYELKRTEDAYKDYENALNNGVEEIYKIIINFKLNKYEEAIKILKNY